MEVILCIPPSVEWIWEIAEVESFEEKGGGRKEEDGKKGEGNRVIDMSKTKCCVQKDVNMNPIILFTS